jgi:hypothetical protein
MRIGIDLDNTLVCYDRLFWTLASERKWISCDVLPSKERVRDELRRLGRESDWTLLQGEVYGPRMNEAAPFPGARKVLQSFRKQGWSVYIVSHRTKVPFAGEPYDLHAAARDWLATHQFLDVAVTGLDNSSVYLETTKAEKLNRIGSLDLTWFIDDLPELLLEPAFPPRVKKLLFDPHRHCPSVPESIRIAHHWQEIPSVMTGDAGS